MNNKNNEDDGDASDNLVKLELADSNSSSSDGHGKYQGIDMWDFEVPSDDLVKLELASWCIDDDNDDDDDHDENNEDDEVKVNSNRSHLHTRKVCDQNDEGHKENVPIAMLEKKSTMEMRYGPSMETPKRDCSGNSAIDDSSILSCALSLTGNGDDDYHLQEEDPVTMMNRRYTEDYCDGGDVPCVGIELQRRHSFDDMMSNIDDIEEALRRLKSGCRDITDEDGNINFAQSRVFDRQLSQIPAKNNVQAMSHTNEIDKNYAFDAIRISPGKGETVTQQKLRPEGKNRHNEDKLSNKETHCDNKLLRPYRKRPYSAPAYSFSAKVDLIEKSSREMEEEVRSFLQSSQHAIEASRKLFIKNDDHFKNILLSHQQLATKYTQLLPKEIHSNQALTMTTIREKPKIIVDTSTAIHSVEDLLTQRTGNWQCEHSLDGSSLDGSSLTTYMREPMSISTLGMSRTEKLNLSLKRKRESCGLRSSLKVSLPMGLLSFIIGYIIGLMFSWFLLSRNGEIQIIFISLTPVEHGHNYDGHIYFKSGGKHN